MGGDPGGDAGNGLGVGRGTVYEINLYELVYTIDSIDYDMIIYVLVTGMIDAFCELIASLNFPWLVCFFLGCAFLCFSLGNQTNQRKTKETKGKP